MKFAKDFRRIAREALSGMLTLGIGTLWLTPYKHAATVAFYREVSCTELIPEEPREEVQ